MKNNLIYFFKIFFAILIVSVLIDKIAYYALNAISDKVYTGQGVGKLNHFLKIKDSKDLIVFGSSRANRHFEVSELSKNGFNIGMDGRKITYPAALVQTLPPHKKQVVIFNIDISYMLDKDYVGQDLDALGTKYNRNKIIRDNINRYHQDNPFQKVYWTIGYNGYIVSILYNFIFPKYDYKKYDGFDANAISQTQQQNLKKQISKAKKEICSNDLKINETTIQAFKELDVFCKKNNKTLIFVASPVFSDQCNEDNILVQKFMKKNKYLYYDYSNYFKGHNSLTYWKDLSHMSGEGAHLFSRQLAKDLNRYIK